MLLPIMSRYTNFAMTSDGLPEINSLAYMPFESAYADPPPTGRLVIVLIEPRLLAVTGRPDLRTELVRCLQRFKGDLRAEGLFSRFIMANLYRGTVHKDGRIVLALRRFLKDVKSTYFNFEGAILVGNFPEASLVRRVSWSPGGKLAIHTGLVSTRAEIVLADLTGNWENIYQQSDFTTEHITAAPDAATMSRRWCDGEAVRQAVFTSSDFTVERSSNFRDAFYIDDAIYTIHENRTTPSRFLRLALNTVERNNEVDLSDRSLVNILARPDISVSRINAFRVAVNPDPSLKGTDGRTFLDAAGNPQVVGNPTPLFGDQAVELFKFRDIDLERRTLISYFERNHRFRVGAFSYLPYRGAVISGSTDFSPDWYEGFVNAAATDFERCVKVPNATLHQYVQFHKTPAVLKYIIAHSGQHNSEFRAEYDEAAFTKETGGRPFSLPLGSAHTELCRAGWSRRFVCASHSVALQRATKRWR